MNILSGNLPDTLTRVRRRYKLVSPAVTSGGMRYSACVTIWQSKPLVTKPADPEEDVYFVDYEERPDLPRGWRSWLWIKQASNHASQPEVYRTLADAESKVRRCECKGAVTKKQAPMPAVNVTDPEAEVGPCKHCDVMRAVLAIFAGEVTSALV